MSDRFVVAAANPFGLPAGTRLAEVRRFEISDHQGRIPSIRTLMAEMRILDGARAGEVIEDVLEQSYEDDPPWGWAGWLVAEDPA